MRRPYCFFGVAVKIAREYKIARWDKIVRVHKDTFARADNFARVEYVSIFTIKFTPNP